MTKFEERIRETNFVTYQHTAGLQPLIIQRSKFIAYSNDVTGRLHGTIVVPTGRSDWSVRPVG